MMAVGADAMKLNLWVLLGCLSLAAAVSAQQLTPIYQQVANPEVDANRIAVVEAAHFHRDRLHFQLQQGLLGLTLPVQGHVTAAVFSGRGVLTVDPPDPINAQQMRFMLGQARIHVHFTQAIFRFPRASELLARLGRQARFLPRGSGLRRLSAILKKRSRRIRHEGLADAAFELGGLYSPLPDRATPWLVAMKTRRFGWIDASVNPLRTEAVAVTQHAENNLAGLNEFQNIWTRFEDRAHRQAHLPPSQVHPELWHLGDYHLRVSVPGNLRLRVQARFTLTALHAAGPGVMLSLDPNLRVVSAHTQSGQALQWLQPRNPGRSTPVHFYGGWLYLQLPAAARRGQKITVSLDCQGKWVAESAGRGNIFMPSEGWYPQYPYGTPFHEARFDLTIIVPKRFRVVATGRRVSNKVQSGYRVTEWRSEPPSAVAGFAVGDYRKFTAQVPMPNGAKLPLEVYANRHADNDLSAIENVNSMNSLGGDQLNQAPGLSNLNPARMANQALGSVGSAVQFMSQMFGPYPYSKLAVVDIPGSYGQGWPSLLYLSSLSFLDLTQQEELGFSPATMRQLSDTFRAHETSHQWWGHVVRWATPHDQWMSEGFANGSAVLYEELRVSPKSALHTLQEWRRDLFQKDVFGYVPNQIGAVWLGSRLSSSIDPQGYQIVTYDKGGYIFYMLCNLMFDPHLKDPFLPFQKMMQAFTHDYWGKAASLSDFEQVADQYMPPDLALDSSHSLSWFFNEYVFHRTVPTLRVTWSAPPAPQGGSTLNLQIINPQGWIGLFPVYLHLGHHRVVRAVIRVNQPQVNIHVHLPYVPKKVIANEFEDMLVHVRG